MRISDWSSDVCSSDLHGRAAAGRRRQGQALRAAQLAGDDPPAVRRFAGPGDRHRDPGARDPDPAPAPERDPVPAHGAVVRDHRRSEEHTSELQSLMRISYAVFCLKKKINTIIIILTHDNKQCYLRT